MRHPPGGKISYVDEGSEGVEPSSGVLGIVDGTWITLNAWLANFKGSDSPLNDEQRLRFVANGVVAGAGGIGDLRFIIGFYLASAGSAAIDAIVTDVSMVEEGQIFGTGFDGNYPLLNSNDTLRIGWSYIRSTGEYIFRIGGDAVPDWINSGHINLWPPSWWLGPP
jgi:hypothetical protein